MKKIILSQKQLDEICGGNSEYLDGLGEKPDVGNIFSTEVSTDGSVDHGYPNPTTTDDFANTLTNNWSRSYGLKSSGAVTLREMSKKEWENMMTEEHEHGNKRLKQRVFGGEHEVKKYGSAKRSINRLKNAERNLKNGSPEMKRKAAQTIRTMKKNWKDIDVAKSQYDTAKYNDKLIQQNKIEKTVTSDPSIKKPKNGVITN